MICRLCLLESNEIFKIFEDDGVKLNIAEIVSKHFWFEPKIDDPISNIICNSCWWKIDSFHIFYLSVEQANKNFAENVAIKNEMKNSNFDNNDDQIMIKTEEKDNNESLKDDDDIDNDDDDDEDEDDGGNDDNKSNNDDVSENESGGANDSSSDSDYVNSTSSKRRRKSKENIIKLEPGLEFNRDNEDTLPVESQTTKIITRSSNMNLNNKSLKYEGADEEIAKFMKLKCGICSKEVATFAEITKHFHIKHNTKGYVVCCNKKLFKRVDVLDHVRKHLNPEHLKCHECNKTFSDQKNLRYHMVRHGTEKTYKCDQCPKDFWTEYQLKIHKSIHVPKEERNFACELCQKSFSLKKDLRRHLSSKHHTEKIDDKEFVKCKFCDKIYSSHSTLQYHLRTAHSNEKDEDRDNDYESGSNDSDTIVKPDSEHARQSREFDEEISRYMKLICDICSEECSTFVEIKDHFQSKHNMKGYVVCCNKKFDKRVYILDHVRVHVNPQYFKCSDCNKVFSNRKCLKNHKLIHDGEKIFSCDECPRNFLRHFDLVTHKKIHVPLEKRRIFDCELCDKSYSSKRGLIFHHRSTHEGSFGNICHICAKVIRDKKSFELHVLDHAGTVPKVQCEICGNWLRDQKGLKRHMKIHTDSTIHLCKFCGKQSPTANALRKHIRFVHSTERTFKCTLCTKAFKEERGLKEHMATHTGEAPYSCPYCPRNFNALSGMLLHKKQHTEGNKHVCNICGKVAPTKVALQSHIQFKHTLEKLFKCDICSKAFKTSAVLKEHINIHTGERPYTCPHCPKTFNARPSMNSHRKTAHPKEYEEGRRRFRNPFDTFQNETENITVSEQVTLDNLVSQENNNSMSDI